MPLAQVILAALNIAIPEVATIVTIFRHKDGTATVVTELSDAATASQTTQQMIANWNTAHPATPAAAPNA
jgi:hypothetical protein